MSPDTNERPDTPSLTATPALVFNKTHERGSINGCRGSRSWSSSPGDGQIRISRVNQTDSNQFKPLKFARSRMLLPPSGKGIAGIFAAPLADGSCSQPVPSNRGQSKPIAPNRIQSHFDFFERSALLSPFLHAEASKQARMPVSENNRFKKKLARLPVPLLE